jgi:hypothetical protein
MALFYSIRCHTLLTGLLVASGGPSRKAQFTCIFIYNENTIFYVLDKYYILML